MKHFMLPRNAILRETHTPTPAEFPSPSPSPSSTAKKPRPSRRNRSTKENDPPPEHHNARFKSLLPPRPPSSNPLKRKLALDVPLTDNSVPANFDSGVKVVVRMRPLRHDKEEVDSSGVKKISNDSLFINGQNFTFDSVADTNATQLDIFELVGAPLVENCLAGFNSSVFAYGQTGSGKTYTIWGPPNSLSEDNLTNDQRGLTPRIFERLFARIDEEQTKRSDQQLKYQCRCSFIEIYNEQITDLLDPNQRNLQIREDVKSGVYVENLTEEPVCSMKDVTQLLIKGLSNRRVGATSINSESSRSHTVFTCVVESRCKSSADGISRFKTSRINLVDLAGSERQKLTGAAGERLKEAGNINRSLSQLGNLINILAEVSQTGKQRHIPYRDSKLTFLLQDSLGGNAKLTMVCAISPAQSCRNETFSTLRFAQRAKAIKNKAVVNEVMHDDVNHLRKVIRQLRDELHQIKANGYSPSDGSRGHSTAWIQRSLNLLQSSLSRPQSLRHVDDDGDEVMEIVEHGVDDHLVTLHNTDGGSAALSAPNASVDSPNPGVAQCNSPPNLKSPTPSVSPTITSSRKSLKTSLRLSPSNNILQGESELDTKIVDQKLCTGFSGQEAPNFLTKNENLAASIGLDVIGSQHHSSALRQSSLELSFKHRESKLICQANKVDVGVQTFLDNNAREEDSVVFDCNNCKSMVQNDVTEIDEGSNMQLVPVGCPESADKPKKKKILKAIEKVLAGSIRREMALEEFCAKQTSEIMQLNHLLQQYKHERECNAIIAQTKEEKILRLESLIDGVLPAEEFLDEELISLGHEHKLLKENYEHHPEVLEMKIELKRVQDELEEYQNFYKLGEKEVLMEEIQSLRNQLQFYVDSSATSARKQYLPLQLTHSSEPSLAANLTAIPDSTEGGDWESENPVCAKEKLEHERSQWADAERKWISLTKELSAELEANKSLAAKRKQELDAERKCVRELNQAMQTAIEGHARLLEQYADLEEQHVELLERHRKIQDGIDDVKKAASRAGVRGPESKFINALAAEITALKAEKEKEIKILRDENRGLRAQLKDTSEAVQAASELLVQLKEAEEGVITAQKRAMDAEQEAAKAYKQVDKLKNKHEKEITTLQELLAEARLPKKEREPTGNHGVIQQFEPFCNEEDSDLAKLAEQSWFSGYDRCNI
ncbi:kinesin-like protein KIN-12B [Arachis duranensis]|uniref:Kinesin-like protein KIN-12B n=1 Tax=Arachis duranensis TaxID=130453 RepID=A0A6P4CXV6_ARADU|nr:kinesin-like protein KIN-12B [Arachis duranensis]XP_052114613.1 kinesin-like protein KIN-12B [Arachis duranensis]